MTLEIFEVFTIFMAGFTVGLIGAHYLNQWERKAEYNRGVLDTLWEFQRAAMRDHLARVLDPSRNKAASSSNGG